jgi:ubiquinone/menaquinone biosynthesis C-methylase UbiE
VHGRPDPQSFDSFAEDYDRSARLSPSTLLDWLLAQLPARGERALDAGCGSGRHVIVLAERFDQVVGIDISEPLINIARERRSHGNVRYQVSDLMNFADPDGFDLVFSSTTLHHLPDLDAALEHLQGLVRPGGRAVLIDNVARRPSQKVLPDWTPARWVHVLGAVREFPGDVWRLGANQAGWLLKFRTSAPWLAHLESDRYLSPQAFEQRYAAVFPGARFTHLGFARGMVWEHRSSP